MIPRLAKDIRNELPKVKGFSERNIGYMIRLAREYGDPAILQQAVAKLQQPENKDVLKVPQAAEGIESLQEKINKIKKTDDKN